MYCCESSSSVCLCVQEFIIETIRQAVEQKLLASNNTRTFTQMQLPFASSIAGRQPSAGLGSTVTETTAFQITMSRMQ